MKAELIELKTKKRQEIAGRLEHAKTLGDLSENAEYQEAKEEQSLVEGQIAELEEGIRGATIIHKSQKSDVVQVGATVALIHDGKDEVYTIVGSEEANPSERRISNESPLGKGFLGRRVGDVVEVKTPGGVVVYKIKEIR